MRAVSLRGILWLLAVMLGLSSVCRAELVPLDAQSGLDEQVIVVGGDHGRAESGNLQEKSQIFGEDVRVLLKDSTEPLVVLHEIGLLDIASVIPASARLGIYAAESREFYESVDMFMEIWGYRGLVASSLWRSALMAVVAGRIARSTGRKVILVAGAAHVYDGILQSHFDAMKISSSFYIQKSVQGFLPYLNRDKAFSQSSAGKDMRREIYRFLAFLSTQDPVKVERYFRGDPLLIDMIDSCHECNCLLESLGY